jgi:uncharacterized protein (DUF1684 family)
MFGKASRERKAYSEEITQSRRRKDRFFGAPHSPHSPIPYDDRSRGFAGLSYYPPNLAFRVQALLVPFRQQGLVELGTTTGEIQSQIRYAELRFRLGEPELRLTGFLDAHYQEHHHGHEHGVELFVPFRDTTSGKETYGAGRYVEAQVERTPDGHEVVTLDFNLAYNPYCAYNMAYSCPLPPAENTLPVAISAGERAYGQSH